MEPTVENATSWWQFIENGGMTLVLAIIVGFIIWLTPKFLAKWGEHIKILENIALRLEMLEHDKYKAENS